MMIDNIVDLINYRIELWSDDRFKDNPTARARMHEAETILKIIHSYQEISNQHLTSPLVSNII